MKSLIAKECYVEMLEFQISQKKGKRKMVEAKGLLGMATFSNVSKA